MWTVCAAGGEDRLAPLFEVETQGQAVELAEQLRQDSRYTRVAIVRDDDPCSAGLLLALHAA